MNRRIIAAWGINIWTLVFGASTFFFLFGHPRFILVGGAIGFLVGYSWARMEIWNTDLKGGKMMNSITYSSILAYVGYVLCFAINLAWIKIEKGLFKVWWEAWLFQVLIILAVISVLVGMIIGACGSKLIHGIKEGRICPKPGKALLIFSLVNLVFFFILPSLSIFVSHLVGSRHWFYSLMRFG
ncbi:MAG: hypothetical protein A2081_04295 [Elusimicrobia bacterium GWC2_61_19]|nr:MAG: hypothetical protein A2081_04295 [Elusimicrobia bacterium GWC2_61_19]